MALSKKYQVWKEKMEARVKSGHVNCQIDCLNISFRYRIADPKIRHSFGHGIKKCLLVHLYMVIILSI